MPVLTEEEKRDYPELLDKIITWSSSTWRHGKPEKARVIGCDYHIGVTLVDADDPSIYVHCLRGPLSAAGKQIAAEGRFYNWDGCFKTMLRGIQTDHVYADDIVAVSHDRHGSSPSASNCPFGQ